MKFKIGCRVQIYAIYTTLHLTNGFFHVPLNESSREYTSFVTQSGQYEVLYLPFGIMDDKIKSKYVKEGVEKS